LAKTRQSLRTALTGHNSPTPRDTEHTALKGVRGTLIVAMVLLQIAKAKGARAEKPLNHVYFLVARALLS